jgi:hypothetical protein
MTFDEIFDDPVIMRELKAGDVVFLRFYNEITEEQAEQMKEALHKHINSDVKWCIIGAACDIWRERSE